MTKIIQELDSVVLVAELKYNDKVGFFFAWQSYSSYRLLQDPLSQDILIDLTRDGVLLRFTSDTQVICRAQTLNKIQFSA